MSRDSKDNTPHDIAPLRNFTESPRKHNLLVLTTGGTIEKTYSESDGSLSNRETVIKNRIQKELRLPYTSIEVKSLMAKDSLDMDLQDREIVCQAIKRFLEYKNPIVVLHGTDTMELTARYCLENLQDIPVPVVFTGAMRPLEFVDTDAVQNVIESFFAAKVLDPGVFIVFHGEVFELPNVTKDRKNNTFVWVTPSEDDAR